MSMGVYGTPRKSGVGFNHARVLGGVMQFDYRRRWDLMRRLTRVVLGPDKQFRWQAPVGSSVTDTTRRYLADKS